VPARSQWDLTREALDRLLAWLDLDRQRAGEHYEQIRAKLIKFFDWRRCPFPEECADETINRVARKVDEGVEVNVDPKNFFFGVAQFVLREQWKQPARVETDFERLPAGSEPRDLERNHHCLDGCLDTLPPPNRELVVQFYQGNGRSKIENRQKLAESLGIPLNALRIRVHRLRIKLEACVTQCLEE
jgi:DNA-directed RNA polymerase specialized sigma24 family protein